MYQATKIAEKQLCYHCGDQCPPAPIIQDEKSFCCEGCKTVYEILSENELCKYYDLEENPGIKLKKARPQGHFAWLDAPEVQAKIVDFSDDDRTHVTFSVPQIHCTSCLWLLENLHKLCEGIIEARVHFLQKEVQIRFRPSVISLREVVELLASLGYEPDLRLEHLQEKKKTDPNRSFYLKLGIAGFAFGNIMLLSFPEYLGEVERSEGLFFGLISLVLSVPVVLYSASDYFRTAYLSLKHRQISIDVPIALGIIALWFRSGAEIIMGWGPGYLDSLAGLLFFLLIGRWFQNKTYDRLAFDRDFTSYFPIAVSKLDEDGDEVRIAVTEIQEGDRLLIRNEEILPVDAVLLSEKASLDYSFVTGEAEPVDKSRKALLYAGGRQAGGLIEVQAIKGVSQSYLTRLWNQDAFKQDDQKGLTPLIDRSSRRFTWIVLSAGILSAAWWWYTSGPGMAINVLTAVLIVACPCALALTMPVTLGMALRVFGRNKFYVKNTGTIERMAGINHVVFDKTGTITTREGEDARFIGKPLSSEEKKWVYALVSQSNHPLSQRVAASLGQTGRTDVEGFREVKGKGLEGMVAGRLVRIGNRTMGHSLPESNQLPPEDAPQTHVFIDGEWRGCFVLPQSYREGLKDVVGQFLHNQVHLSVLSGDHDGEKTHLETVMGTGADLKFRQSPHEKLAYIKGLQDTGDRVLMIGDGLNDAGALKQSQVGIAISEDENNFSPASDAILDAGKFNKLASFWQFSRISMNLVKAGFGISATYNVVGLTIAMKGLLTPLVAAVLMPLSSLTTVLFAVLAIHIAAWRKGI